MRNVLVTGAAGFIGTNLVYKLLRSHAAEKVVAFDALTYAGNRANLVEAERWAPFHFFKGDVSKLSDVYAALEGHAIDTIIHLAAESHVDRSLHDPEAFVRTNVLGTFTLLEAARDLWLKRKPVGFERPFRFHHVSTDEVYGALSPDAPAFTEKTAYDPSSPYSASKASSDHLVRAYGRTYGLPFTITNCSNNYGPYQYPEKLIPVAVLAARDGRPIPVYGQGLQVRDWLHVEDHCDAIILAIEKGLPGETYNVGGGGEITNIDLVRKICAMMDLSVKEKAPHESLIQYVADRPGHDFRYAVDSTKIRTQLGWSPKIGLDAGLRQTVNWYLLEPEWVSEVLSRGGYAEWQKKNYEERPA